MLQTLQDEGPGRASGHVSTTLAENYNRLLDDIVATVPDLEGSLPSKIGSSTPFATLGASDASFVDLKVFLNQVVDLLDAVSDE